MDLMAMFGEANADTARCHGGGCHYDIRSYDNGNITCRRGVPPWRSPTWQTSRCFCCVAILARASGSMPLAASRTSSRACCWKVPRPTPSSHWPQPGTASRSFPRMRKCRAARSVRCRSFTAGYRSENGRSSLGTPSGSWRRMPRSSSRKSWPTAVATIRVAISSDAHHHCPGQRYEQQSTEVRFGSMNGPRLSQRASDSGHPHHAARLLKADIAQRPSRADFVARH